MTPPTLNGVGGPKGHTPESIELNQVTHEVKRPQQTETRPVGYNTELSNRAFIFEVM